MTRISWRSKLTITLLLCSILNTSFANELPSEVANALKHAGIPTKSVGVVVQEVENHRTLIALNQGNAFSPASTMKLVTTSAALELLGPTFTWKTQVYTTGSTNGDALNGNLIFRGGGDPKLVLENFWLLLRQIRAAGIRDIRGKVILDRSAFEPVQYDSGKFDGDPIKPYNAVPDALLLNYQTLALHFTPITAGGSASLTVDPPLAGYDVSPPQWGNDDCGDWQGKLAINMKSNGIRFDGHFPIACGEKTWYIRPYNMAQNQYFGAIFKKMWRDLGGQFSGEVIDGETPADARFVTMWESNSLPEIIRDINKLSNNVMARQLLLTLVSPSAESNRQANTERAAQTIKAWLGSKGIDAPELVIENGSGLSRNERIAPANMSELLIAAYKSPMMPEFMSSLPVVGYDGTMRHRLTNRDVAGNAHIKTGTLNDVKAVAGYVLAASGKYYTVVFFVNHPNAAAGAEAQDALLNWIYNHG